MRFHSVIAGGVFALAVKAQSGTSTADMSMPPTSTMALSPAQASEKACREQCPVTDVNCRAHCEPVPAPSGDQAIATNECVAKCDKSNTDAYAKCSQDCIKTHYFEKGSGTPDPKHAVDSTGSDSSSSNVVEKAASSSSSSSSSSAANAATDMSSGMMNTASGATTMATETSTMTDMDMSSSSSSSRSGSDSSPTSSGSGSRAAASSSSSQGWAPAVTAAPAAALGLVAMALAL
ncbi:hypothetical protein GQ602_000335 [Ophiocordyceps camponoti-floridani]|uniref:Extracellular membrane protein CFEM domain-containing protein n=1 Tax=Ophiocordyceps camponoti-floridani TaxID=2030778 RepID=A0A8H4QC19_9HYPO|nr:hypothetical protein GQ602_000335 [Ophiocordyceps camponoti-floridani]